MYWTCILLGCCVCTSCALNKISDNIISLFYSFLLFTNVAKNIVLAGVKVRHTLRLYMYVILQFHYGIIIVY